MESCGEANHWEQVSTSLRTREVRERLLHRLVLRVPKATLETLRAYGEDLFRATFGLELDWKAVGKQITGSRCQPA